MGLGQISLGAKVEDFESSFGQYFATAEFKATKFGFMAFVIVTGPGSSHAVAVHHSGQIAISGEARGRVEVQRYLEAITKFLAEGEAGDGFGLKEAAIDGRAIRRAAISHLSFHKRSGQFGQTGTPLYEITNSQFFLVMQFGIPKPKQLLAEVENVPITTISRRLAAARQQHQSKF